MTSMPYRRKREGKTDYKKRLRLLVSAMPRLVVRKSNRNISVQLVDYSPDGDVVVCAASSCKLKKYGWKVSRSNLPTAYLTGLLLGKLAKQKKIKEAVLDLGLYPSTKGSRVYACLKGVLDAGIYVPHSADILPSEDRIKGGHIAGYAKQIRNEQERFKLHFGNYEKEKIEPEQLEKYFAKAKEQIQNENK